MKVSDNAPTWLEIDKILRSTEPPEERNDFDSMATGRGKSNHKANVRLFDAPEGFEPEVTLYRDTAGWYDIASKIMENLDDNNAIDQVSVLRKGLAPTGRKKNSL